MVQQIGPGQPPGAPNPRAQTADARSGRTSPARSPSPEEAARVDLDRGAAVGGFRLELGYGREVTRGGRVVAASHEGLALEFRFATAALPRGADGEVDLAELANTEEKAGLLEALERIAREGLQEPGAAATFISAVDRLFGEYAQDLGLEPEALAGARQLFVDEVTGFFEAAEAEGADRQPGLRERVLDRRQDLLVSAGDLSKVLAELTAEARTDGSAGPLGRLGRFLDDLREAARQRSTRGLRDAARQRLVSERPEPPARPAGTDPVGLARGFLAHLRPAGA